MSRYQVEGTNIVVETDYFDKASALSERLEKPADLSLRTRDAWAVVELPCGCFLVNNDGTCAAELRFCEAHAKVKIVKRDPNWKATVAAAIASVARRLPSFTTDDVWAELGNDASAGDPRAIGPAMSAAEDAGVCAATEEHIKSARRECHGRPVRVWRSLVLKGGRAR